MCCAPSSTPDDVGVHDLSGRRRVAGLRRAEVALRAGVSTDYYVRLEQGRDQHPSPQVLDALARALQLDEDATAHLHRLANAQVSQRRKRSRREKVPAGIVQMIQLWSENARFRRGPLHGCARGELPGDRAGPVLHGGYQPRSGDLP